MKKFILTGILAIFFLLPSGISQEPMQIVEADFYATKNIQDIKLYFAEDNWSYLLDTLRKNGNRYLLGHAEINGKKYKNIGVQIADGRGFQPDQKRNDLVIKLNLVDRVQNHQGYSTIHLSCARRDPSMVREVLGFEIARDYMPAPKANYARVSINDKYYGLLVNIESVDRKFLETNFGDSDGTFFKGEPEIYPDAPDFCKKRVYSSLVTEEDVRCYFYNYKIQSEFGWDDLMALAETLENDPDNIDQILNIDRTLWMLAFNNAVANLSSYSGAISENYYLYKTADGRFNPVVWDLNLAFGSFKNTGRGSDLNLQSLISMNPLLHQNNISKPLISKLLGNDKYRKIYLSHLRQINREWFVSGKYAERAEELQRLIQIPISNDVNKFYNWDEFKGNLKKTVGKRSKIPGIEELMRERARYLKKEKNLAVFPPKFISQELKKRERLANKRVETFKFMVEMSKYTKTVSVFYRFPGETEFTEKVLLDNGKSGDGKAGDGMFGGEILPSGGNTIEYYYQSENASLVSFEPANYYFKTYTASIDDLN